MSRIIKGSHAVRPRYRVLGLLLVALAVAVAVGGATSRSAQAVLDPTLPNTVQQWNKLAEDTVVGSGAFQGEGEVYMSYTSLAVYDAVVAIQGGYEPYGPAISAPAGASVDAAVIEAAYWTLSTYFPAAAASLSIDRSLALAAIQAAPAAKTDGIAVGLAAASGIITLRTGDGRQTPIATTSPVEKKDPGPGVWRLTPPAFAAPQTPWLGSVQPFLLKSPGQFKTEPPVPLRSSTCSFAAISGWSNRTLQRKQWRTAPGSRAILVRSVGRGSVARVRRSLCSCHDRCRDYGLGASRCLCADAERWRRPVERHRHRGAASRKDRHGSRPPGARATSRRLRSGARRARRFLAGRS